MPRYIDTEKINYQYLPIPAIGDQFITKSAIDNMPEEDVAEVKHGLWIDTTAYCGEFTCSICKETCVTNKYKYCPHCGAKMGGGK